ncbi:MAG: alpha/beta hydrolase [Cyanobacteria bacterium P01_H01_bin.74]
MNFRVFKALLRFNLCFLLLVLISVGAFAKSETKDIKIFTDTIQYNQHKQKMKLCLPQENPDDSFSSFKEKPFFLLVHGGAWTVGFGSRYDFYSHCKYLARHGFPAASVSYRLAPKYTYPAAYNDVKDAVVWVNEHIEDYNNEKIRFDPSNIILAGHSAGGHLSLLVGLREKTLPLAGIISLAGPTDLTTKDACKLCTPQKKGFLKDTPPELASPVNYARPDAPPVYLFHGDQDYVVDVSQSYAMKKALDDVGAKVKLRVLDTRRHWFPFVTKKEKKLVVDILDFIIAESTMAVANNRLEGDKKNDSN